MCIHNICIIHTYVRTYVRTHACMHACMQMKRLPFGLHDNVEKKKLEQISTPLAHVFDMSLQEGIVPLEWKEANSIPLLKKVQETSKLSTSQFF